LRYRRTYGSGAIDSLLVYSLEVERTRETSSSLASTFSITV